jgi:hypothetical protein
MIADNQTAQLAEPDDEILAALLQEQADAGYDLLSVGSDEETLRQMLEVMADRELGLEEEVERPAKNTKPNPRKLPIDMIYTLQMADCTCCLAVQAGLKYGIQSAQYSLCPYTDLLSGRHKVTFIDNDYFNYDHGVHLAAVKELRPKYATVKDIMTPNQCREDKIEHTSFEQIMEWAEELSQYAENVIVIPKYDCIDKIPEKFVLGYSVPSSHGATPLPVEAFKGRRVHLLGGSWQAQLSYMAVLGDDVVSADNNQILLIASKFGSFVRPDGESESLTEAGFGALVNPRYVALAISFGSIAAKINEICTPRDETADEWEEEEEV